jgi:hypothetical protein
MSEIIKKFVDFKALKEQWYKNHQKPNAVILSKFNSDLKNKMAEIKMGNILQTFGKDK